MLPSLLTRQSLAFKHGYLSTAGVIRASLSPEPPNRIVGEALTSLLTAKAYRYPRIAMSTDSIAQSNATPSGGQAVQASSNAPSHHVANPGLLGPRFKNPWDTYEARSFSEVLKWHRDRRKEGFPGEGHLRGIAKPTEADYRRTFPLQPVDWAALAAPPADGLQAVWVGHATVLAQMGGMTFLTDPVFSERCAPVQFAGPKRVVPPALCGTEPQLPPLDFVLLSHNHYDHLDAGSVKTLNQRFGKSLTWYVPLGLREWFRCEGVPPAQVVELDWWQQATHTSSRTGGSVTITMVPAQHWSARGLLDRYRTLWGGFVVTAPPPPQASSPPAQQPHQQQDPPQQKGPGWSPIPVSCTGTCPSTATSAPAPTSDPSAAASASSPAPASTSSPSAPAPLRFFFAGDTGYCSVFKEIGERLGPIDLAAIPIGAYEPRWFMRPQHVTAEEGLQVAEDVRAAVSIGIHTATWALTDEPMDEPPARLQAALRERGLPASSFVTLQHGDKAVVRGGRLVNQPKTLPATEPPQ